MAGSNVSSVTNHFATVVEGFATTTSGTTSSGATTVGLSSVTNLTNGAIFVGLIEPGEAKEQAFTGTVDTGGSQITGVKWTRGTNTSHASGVTVVDYTTGTLINMINKGILVHANQDGTLKDDSVDTAQIADDAVDSPQIAAGAVDAEHISSSELFKLARISSSASGDITPDIDTYNMYIRTAQAAALNINAPTGTPSSGQSLIFRIKDNGTARAITWDATFRAVGLTLPTTTVISKVVYVGCIYNSDETKWDAIAIAEEE